MLDDASQTIAMSDHQQRMSCFQTRKYITFPIRHNTFNAQPAVQETNYLRHVRFEKPVVVKMDGKKKLGVVLMPGVDK